MNPRRRKPIDITDAESALRGDRLYASLLREVESVSRGHAHELVKLCAVDMEHGQAVLAMCAALIQWARVDERKKYLAKIGE